MVGVSVRGSYHEERDQPCQDAHYWRILPSGPLVVAVADGAGSASLGDVGAQLAAGTAVTALAESGIDQRSNSALNDDAIGQYLVAAIENARDAVEAEAESREVEPRELATTLILMIATGDFIAVAQVGDGAAVVGDNHGDVFGVTHPQNGEYLNETTFLVSPEAMETLQTSVWRGTPVQGAIFSDGIQMLCLKMPEGLPHAPFFRPLFTFVSEIEVGASCADTGPDNAVGSGLNPAQEELRTFLLSPSVQGNTADDLTLLLFSFGEPDHGMGPEPAVRE